MAKLKIFSIRDSKTDTYMNPFSMLHRGQALRAWEQLVNDEKTEVSKFPADFHLFELAEFDDSTGQYTNIAQPLNLGCALEVKHRPETAIPLFAGKEA